MRIINFNLETQGNILTIGYFFFIRWLNLDTLISATIYLSFVLI